jgi:hypothetical protein
MAGINDNALTKPSDIAIRDFFFNGFYIFSRFDFPKTAKVVDPRRYLGVTVLLKEDCQHHHRNFLEFRHEGGTFMARIRFEGCGVKGVSVPHLLVIKPTTPANVALYVVNDHNGGATPKPNFVAFLILILVHVNIS